MALFEIIKKEKDDENIVWKYPKTDFNKVEIILNSDFT